MSIAVEMTQKFVEGVEEAAKNGQVFSQDAGIDDGLVLTVSPDGGAVCHLFRKQVATLPAGSTPDEVLTFWSESVRKFAPSYSEAAGTMTFVKDLRVGDVIVDEDGLNAKVVCTLGGDPTYVTLISHGYITARNYDGKQIQKFREYPEGSMKAVDLLWASDGDILYQND